MYYAASVSSPDGGRDYLSAMQQNTHYPGFFAFEPCTFVSVERERRQEHPDKVTQG
jgi:hypothetical protein